MKRLLQSAAAQVLTHTPLGLWPVRVRRGVAEGARWTLYPWTSYWRGTHEPRVQSAIMALGGGEVTGWVCWDLGAHFGLYSVGLAKRVGPTGEVAAFEPNPKSYTRLKRHQRMNGVEWLKTFPCAVSERSGKADLLTYGDLGTTSTHLAYENEALTAETGPLSVATVALDELVERGELRLPQFIKIDVEGHAHKAMKGMVESVAKARPVLLVGFHSELESSGVRAILDPLGYFCEAVTTDERGVCGDFLFRPGR